MTETPNPLDFRTRLLEAENDLSSSRYEEHRMQLEQRITLAEKQLRWIKWGTMTAGILSAVLFPVVASQAFGSADPFDSHATIASVLLMVTYAVCAAGFFVGVASYYSRFLPRQRQLREQLQSDTLQELFREVRALRTEVNHLRDARIP